MKAEKLFDAITNIDDSIIDEAKDTKLSSNRPAWLKWGTAAAVALVAVGLGAVLIGRIGGSAGTPGSSAGGNGHGESTVFMSYAGPVFPLTLLQPDGAITAERELTYDFAPETDEYGSRVRDIGVLDEYTLKNSSAEDRNLTVIYPFAGSFNDMDVPELSLDGAPLQTALHCGPYSGGFQGAGDDESESLNLDNITSWEGYRALLADGTYIGEAFSAYPELTAPVTVYEFANAKYTSHGEEAVNPTLNMAFNIDYDETIILTWGFNGGRYDPDTGDTERHFSLPKEGTRRYDQPYRLIAMGTDIGEYVIQGYENGGCEAGGEVDITADVKRYETTLGDILRTICEEYYEITYEIEYYGDNNRFISGDVGFDMYFGEVCRFFKKYGVAGERAKERYQFGMLEDIIGETVIHPRVFYLAAEVTVPAGGEVTLAADMVKAPSFDFICSGSGNEGLMGYDMVTRLGTNLEFDSLLARLINTQAIEIVRQNYGFDLEAGVAEARLDTAVEHYYIEIRQRDD